MGLRDGHPRRRRFAGVVLATALPERSREIPALVVTADAARITARVGDAVVVDEPVRSGACTYRAAGDAGPLVLTRDGTELGRTALPQVDALITAVPDGGPRVTVRVDDRSASVPSALKVALMVLTAVAAVVAVTALVLLTRRRRVTRRRRRWRPVPADAGVVAVLVAWLFLAPMTHDDGWMYAMARNAEHAGFFGNYYMYRNNSYVPFTWLLSLYAEWGRLGAAPVLQRVPSLAFALVTWASVRSALRPTTTRPRAWWVPALLFLAWWLPFGLGTRQEASVAAALMLTVAALLAARRRSSPALLGLAVGAAAMGVIAGTEPAGGGPGGATHDAVGGRGRRRRAGGAGLCGAGGVRRVRRRVDRGLPARQRRFRRFHRGHGGRFTGAGRGRPLPDAAHRPVDGQLRDADPGAADAAGRRRVPGARVAGPGTTTGAAPADVVVRLDVRARAGRPAGHPVEVELALRCVRRGRNGPARVAGRRRRPISRTTARRARTGGRRRRVDRRGEPRGELVGRQPDGGRPAGCR